MSDTMYFVLYRNCSWGIADGPMDGIAGRDEARRTADEYSRADGRDWCAYEAETRNEAKRLAMA